MYSLPERVTAIDVDTDRLRMRCLTVGPDGGTPVVLVHGNLSTGLFWDHLMAAAPPDLRLVAPDMRGFGDTERKPIDATRGLRDWADDVAALVHALRIDAPAHLVGWSTGGGAVMQCAIDRPDAVASLTLIDPVSPYGFGATKDTDGTPTSPDYAGSGGGVAAPEFVRRLREGDRSDDSDFSPRNVMRAFYWHPGYRLDPEREDALVDEVLKSQISDDGYPGDLAASQNWPGVAPGTRGILNALSGRWCNVSGIVDISPKPPVLWIRGDGDLVIGDQSMFDVGTLGRLGQLPEWPGDDVHPPQPMTEQTRAVLGLYAARAGEVREEVITESSHGPFIDHLTECAALVYGFITGRAD
jgi:pimeloyl-ACP methyl ester carboxylesterase